MDDYQMTTLILGAVYSVVELAKWLYNKQAPALNAEEGRMLSQLYHDHQVKDATGRPMWYREPHDVVALQKETVSEMRGAIHDLRDMVKQTNTNVNETNKMLQTFLLKVLEPSSKQQ